MSGTLPERWPEIERELDRVLDADPAERTALLATLEEDDPEIHFEVATLLEHAEREHDLLDRDAAAIAGPALAGLDPSGAPGAGPGTYAGPYRLVEAIGGGGMGVVWRAERDDEELRQTVAVKLLRPVAATPEELRRFHAERQILASLRHPRIAQVLDAGTTADGQPYLAMELVEGLPVLEYCEHQEMGLEGRLRLFDQVLEAVAYAHRHLVVHRDLKPSNILVTADGQVKLLDFGISKLLEPGSVALDAAPATRTGLYLMTPEYAAPEQLRGDPVSTAADVWALGVLLYELLSGRRPFDLVGLSLAEIERLVIEAPPRRPSSSVAEAGRVAAPELRGDLDTIVLTALRQEPAERYGTVAELARDLNRHRQGLPIGARPATLSYRARKFARRHRVAVAAAVLVALTIALGVAASLWQAEVARRQAARAEAISEFLFRLFEGADPEQHPGEPATALELLEAGALEVDGLDAGTETRVDLLRVLGSLFGRLGQAERSEALLRRGVAESEALRATDRASIEVLESLANRLILSGDPAEAEDLLRRALAARERAGDSEGSLIDSRTALGLALRGQGRLDEAEPLLRQSIEARERLDGPDAPALGSELHNLASLLLEREDWQQAETVLLRIAEVRERVHGPDHPALGRALWELAILRGRRGDAAGAEKLHREVLRIRRAAYPGGHPGIANSLSQVALQLQNQGRLEQAEGLYQQALEQWRALYGTEHPHLGVILSNLAALRYRQGSYAAGAGAQRQALAIWRVSYGDADHRSVASGLNNLGVMEREMGRLEEGSLLLQQALEMRRRLYGESHSSIALSLLALGNLRRLEGRYREAEPLVRESIAIYGQALPVGHVAISEAWVELAAVLVEQDRAPEAIEAVEVGLEILLDRVREDDRRLGQAHLWRGAALARLDQAAQARHSLTDAARILASSSESAGPDARRVLEELARLDGRTSQAAASAAQPRTR